MKYKTLRRVLKRSLKFHTLSFILHTFLISITSSTPIPFFLITLYYSFMNTFSRTNAVKAASILLFSASVLLNACRPVTDPTKELEEVLPNALTLNNTQGNATATWRSSSDTKGMATRIDTLILVAGRTYTGTITAVNDTKTPTVDLTSEYKELGNEHQFFYTISGDAQSRLTFTITDKDSNNLPLGLQFNAAVTAGAAARGTLNVVLGHYDDVKKTGTNRSPETDIDINFPVVIR
jgi:hypothetical protein